MAWMGAMNSIGGSIGSAIAGQFIDRMGSRGGFIVVTALALTSLAIAMLGFKQDQRIHRTADAYQRECVNRITEPAIPGNVRQPQKGASESQ